MRLLGNLDVMIFGVSTRARAADRPGGTSCFEVASKYDEKTSGKCTYHSSVSCHMLVQEKNAEETNLDITRLQAEQTKSGFAVGTTSTRKTLYRHKLCWLGWKQRPKEQGAPPYQSSGSSVPLCDNPSKPKGRGLSTQKGHIGKGEFWPEPRYRIGRKPTHPQKQANKNTGTQRPECRVNPPRMGPQH